MKIKKFNENIDISGSRSIEEALELRIYDIIVDNVELEPYYDDVMQISDKSREKTAKQIVQYLINNLTSENLDQLLINRDSKKYNL